MTRRPPDRARLSDWTGRLTSLARWRWSSRTRSRTRAAARPVGVGCCCAVRAAAFPRPAVGRPAPPGARADLVRHGAAARPARRVGLRPARSRPRRPEHVDRADRAGQAGGQAVSEARAKCSSGSLAVLSPEERQTFERLSRQGIGRHDARTGRDPVDVPTVRHRGLPRHRRRVPGRQRRARALRPLRRARPGRQDKLLAAAVRGKNGNRSPAADTKVHLVGGKRVHGHTRGWRPPPSG